jgi:hypothetical protein
MFIRFLVGLVVLFSLLVPVFKQRQPEPDLAGVGKVPYSISVGAKCEGRAIGSNKICIPVVYLCLV